LKKEKHDELQAEATVGACLQAIAAAGTAPGKNRRQAGSYSAAAQAPWQIEAAV